MAETKDARVYIRTTTAKKEFFEKLAKKYTKGNVNALFDKLVEELMEEEGED